MTIETELETETAAEALAAGPRAWPRYPAYRDSGVEWLGEIPAHWVVKRLRFACTLNPTKAEISGLPLEAEVSFLPMEAIGEDGELSLEQTRTLEQVREGYTFFRDGDVLVAKITPCFENGKGALCAGLLNGIGFGTTELHVIRAGANLDSKFALYVTHSHPFRNLGVAAMKGAAGQQRVPEIFIKDYPVPLPPLAEQRAIAAFLDRETARLDTLVAAKERLITLLLEKRAALISHAVTRGLDASVPLRESGVPWLGEIPAHWELRRNKTIFHEITERSVYGDEELLTVSHITGVTPRREKDVNMFLAESMEGYKVCHPGDFVVNTMWAWMGAVGTAHHHGIVSPSYNVYCLREPVAHDYDVDYLDLLYRTSGYVCGINSYSQGIWQSRLRLYPEAFFELRTITPPAEEQHQIVAHCARQSRQIDDFISKLTASVEKVKEYRAALIVAAVTGKINVRASAPEESER